MLVLLFEAGFTHNFKPEQHVRFFSTQVRISRMSPFFQGVTEASNRFGIPVLSTDFRDMRNDLIHDGTLSGHRFIGKTVADCRIVASDVVNWIDAYVHAAFGLGAVRRVRFDAHSFDGLNAYSL